MSLSQLAIYFDLAWKKYAFMQKFNFFKLKKPNQTRSIDTYVFFGGNLVSYGN